MKNPILTRALAFVNGNVTAPIGAKVVPVIHRGKRGDARFSVAFHRPVVAVSFGRGF